MSAYSLYDCPTCGWEPPAFEGKYYHRNGKKYPVFGNAHQYFNGSFDMNDWDETHYCSNCKKEFTFTNGSV